jgi:plasmid stabilization system protein ParE
LSYQIEFTDRAMDDADAAFARIYEHSPRRAATWYQKLFQHIDTLAEHPTRCPLARESRKFSMEIRELLYGKRSNKYRIIFTIRDANTVVILYIYHGARHDLEPDQ